MLKQLKENPVVFAFSTFNLFYRLSITIVVPFFSLILIDAGWSTQQITYFFALSSLVVFLLGPGVGRLSDVIGKKIIISFGLVLQTIFFIIYFFFMEFVYLMLIARTIEIIASICIMLVGISAVEEYVKENRGYWMGVFLSIGTIGILIGPILAGFFMDYFSSRILLLVAVLFTLLSVIFLFKLPNKKNLERQFTIADMNPLREIKHFLDKKKLRGMALLGIIVNSKGQFYVIFFPILVVEIFNYPSYYLGFLLAIPSFFRIFQFYFGKISDFISAEFGILLGVFLSGSSLFFIPYVFSFPFLIFLLVVYGIGGSIWNISAWSLMGDIAKREDIPGEIVTTYFSISKLGVFVSTLSSAVLVSIFTIPYTFQLFSIVLILGVVVSYFFLSPIFHHETHKSYFHILHKKE